MQNLRMRLAADADAAGILAVYAPYIATPVSFEEDVPDLDAFRERVAAIRKTYPYLVVETADDAGKSRGGRIVGYAYAHAQHERAAYGWNAELSVYLAPEAQGRGTGGALYEALLELLRAQGTKAAYALVTVPNPASEALHAAFGFRLMGVQSHAGYTCGAWRDVAWLVKPLAGFDDDPQPVVPFPRLAEQRPRFVRDVLARANERLAENGALKRSRRARTSHASS